MRLGKFDVLEEIVVCLRWVNRELRLYVFSRVKHADFPVDLLHHLPPSHRVKLLLAHCIQHLLSCQIPLHSVNKCLPLGLDQSP